VDGKPGTSPQNRHVIAISSAINGEENMLVPHSEKD
jgi:hypothetical protein